MNLRALSALLALATLPIATFGPAVVRLDPEPEPSPDPPPFTPWLRPRRVRQPRPDLRIYDGPRVAHVETKGRRKLTRRERKAR